MQSLAQAPKTPTITLPPEVEQALSGDNDMAALLEFGSTLAGNLALAALILFVTFWGSGRLAGLARQGVARAQPHRGDGTLPNLAAGIVRYGVIVVGLIAVLQQLGVRATSVIAVLGAASLAVGLALQGTLGNVAAGVMLLVLRPYRIGDDVEISGERGIVRRMDLFSTRLESPDGQFVFVPNGRAFGDTITNYTALGRARLQIDFALDYADDSERAARIAIELASAHEKVLKEPRPWAGVTELAHAGVMISLRAWTAPSDQVQVRSDLMAAAKAAIDESGLSFSHRVTELDLMREARSFVPRVEQQRPQAV